MEMGYDPQNDVLRIAANADDDILYAHLLKGMSPLARLVVEVRASTINYPSPKPTPPGADNTNVQHLWSPVFGVSAAEAYVRIRVWQSTKSENYLANRHFLIGAPPLSPPLKGFVGKNSLGLSSSVICGAPVDQTKDVTFPASSPKGLVIDRLSQLDPIPDSGYEYKLHAWTPYGSVPVGVRHAAKLLILDIEYWRTQAPDGLLNWTMFRVHASPKMIPLLPGRVDVTVFADLPMASISKIVNSLSDPNINGYSLVVIDPNGVRMAAKNSYPLAITEAIRSIKNMLSEEGRETTSFWIAPSDWPLLSVIEENSKQAMAKVSTLKKGSQKLETSTIGDLIKKIDMEDAEASTKGMSDQQAEEWGLEKSKLLPVPVPDEPKSGGKTLAEIFDEANTILKEQLGVVSGKFTTSLKDKPLKPVGPVGVPLTSLPKLIPAKQPAAFKGKLFCLTGTLSADRNKIASLITYLGGKFKNSVTSGTKILIIGTKPGATMVAAAQKFGINILSEMEFWQMVPEKVRLQFFQENSLAMVMQYSKPVDGSIIPGTDDDDDYSKEKTAPKGKSAPAPSSGRKVILE